MQNDHLVIDGKPPKKPPDCHETPSKTSSESLEALVAVAVEEHQKSTTNANKTIKSDDSDPCIATTVAHTVCSTVTV